MELWDIYDENGLFTGKVIQRGEKMFPGEYHILVLGVIRNSDGLFLVTQRSEKIKYPGMWEFPGGAVKHGESPVQAVKREISEEIGLEISDGELGRQLCGKCDSDKYPYLFHIFIINKNIDLCLIKTDALEIANVTYLSMCELSDYVEKGLFLSGIFNNKDILFQLGDYV